MLIVTLFDAVLPKVSVTVAFTDKDDVSASVPVTVPPEYDPPEEVGAVAVPVEYVIVGLFPVTFKYVPDTVPVQFVGVVSSRAAEKEIVGALFAT